MQFLSSFSILIYLVVGAVLGATIFPRRLLWANNRLITIGLALVLFTMGASLGGSPTLLADLAAAGSQAAVLAVAATAGSVLVVWLLTRLFVRGRE